MNSQNFRISRLCILFVVPLIIIIIGAMNNNYIRVSQYAIEVPRKTSEITRLRIAFAADFHLREATNTQILQEVVTKINSLNPDVLLICGDVLEGDRHGEETDRFEELFRQIKTKYGVFAVPGNHEMHGEAKETFLFIPT